MENWRKKTTHKREGERESKGILLSNTPIFQAIHRRKFGSEKRGEDLRPIWQEKEAANGIVPTLEKISLPTEEAAQTFNAGAHESVAASRRRLRHPRTKDFDKITALEITTICHFSLARSLLLHDIQASKREVDMRVLDLRAKPLDRKRLRGQQKGLIPS